VASHLDCSGAIYSYPEIEVGIVTAEFLGKPQFALKNFRFFVTAEFSICDNKHSSKIIRKAHL
jgi:hypothetical protein